MTKFDTYTAKGVKGSSVSLPSDLDETMNKPLLAQALRVYESMSHVGTSSTKSRGEVVASTRKIYRQKGTGRARHGSISAPIFVGGGKAHGAKFDKRSLSLSKTQRRKSLAVALTMKAKKGSLFGISNLSTIKKTHEASALLLKILGGKETKVTLVIDDTNKLSRRFFRNISFVQTVPFSSLNTYLVYWGGTIILDTDALSSAKVTETKKTTSVKSATKPTKKTTTPKKTTKKVTKKKS